MTTRAQAMFWVLSAINLLIVVVLMCSDAKAQTVRPLTLADVCQGYTLSKKGDDVLIRCPGDPVDKPWFTFKDCKNPQVTQRTADKVALKCNPVQTPGAK